MNVKKSGTTLHRVCGLGLIYDQRVKAPHQTLTARNS
jgi:hypothetical protein